MTALGIVLAVLLVVGASRGRLGILYTAAAVAPFSDSAAVIVGRAVVPPFYFCLLVYFALGAFTGRTRRDQADLAESLRSGPLGALLAYATILTFVAPNVFAGTGVVAASRSIDAQVDRLTPLNYSSSNLAQIVYLSLVVLLVATAPRNPEVRRRCVEICLTVGTIAGVVMYVLEKAGISYHRLFDNSPRQFYSTYDPRFRGFLSEPSHLGVLALAATAYFLAAALRSGSGRYRLRQTVLAGCGVFLFVVSASATAIIGGAIAAAVLGGGWTWRVIAVRSRKGSAQPATVLAALVVLVTGIALLPSVITLIERTIRTKQLTTTSYSTRLSTDTTAYHLLYKSWLLGVGLGSNRSSSLLLLLLSNVGLVGTILFAVSATRALRRGFASPASTATAISLLALICASFVSLADLSLPILWLLVAHAWVANQDVGQHEPFNRGTQNPPRPRLSVLEFT
jgi:hypothetical protein